MINDKQSSIEWLTQQVVHLDWQFLTQEKKRKICEQAKTMHKEEIVNTWSEATSLDYEIGLLDASYILCQIHNAEQYYKETYGGNNEQQ